MNMKKYNIFRCGDAGFDKVKPDFIYNRFDLWDGINIDDVSLWCCESTERRFYFETYASGDMVQLGIWLMPMDKHELQRIIEALFQHYRDAKTVHYENGFCAARGHIVFRNHFRIELPESSELLEQRLSAKGRYNIKREKRILNEAFGKYEISKFPASPTSVGEAKLAWERYFQLKKITHGADYGMAPDEYCEKHHVTDLYILTVGEVERVAAIALSCEQCSIAYLENITYDTELAGYSPGQILYDEYLKQLINERGRGIQELYLLGGSYAYKKRYGSIEEEVFHCTVYRNPVVNMMKYGISMARKYYHKWLHRPIKY